MLFIATSNLANPSWEACAGWMMRARSLAFRQLKTSSCVFARDLSMNPLDDLNYLIACNCFPTDAHISGEIVWFRLGQVLLCKMILHSFVEAQRGEFDDKVKREWASERLLMIIKRWFIVSNCNSIFVDGCGSIHTATAHSISSSISSSSNSMSRYVHKTMIILLSFHSASIMSRTALQPKYFVVVGLGADGNMMMVGDRITREGNERWWEALISLGSHEWSFILRLRTFTRCFSRLWDIKTSINKENCHVCLHSHRCRVMTKADEFDRLPDFLAGRVVA